MRVTKLSKFQNRINRSFSDCIGDREDDKSDTCPANFPRLQLSLDEV